MPALGFQKQFVPMIEDGTKHHTIRRKRKNPIKDALYLYTGMRTKQCRKRIEMSHFIMSRKDKMLARFAG